MQRHDRLNHRAGRVAFYKWNAVHHMNDPQLRTVHHGRFLRSPYHRFRIRLEVVATKVRL